MDEDVDSTQSDPAVVMINFNHIDNPPVLDLNGPLGGRDYTSVFTEGADPVMVSIYVHFKKRNCFMRRLCLVIVFTICLVGFVAVQNVVGYILHTASC